MCGSAALRPSLSHPGGRAIADRLSRPSGVSQMRICGTPDRARNAFQTCAGLPPRRPCATNPTLLATLAFTKEMFPNRNKELEG